MEPWIVLIVVIGVGVLVYLAQRFGWIDLSNKSKSSGKGGGVIGIGDEVFNASRYEAQVEMDRQTVLPAPAPVAGDRDLGMYDGQVRIDLAGDGSRASEPRGKHRGETSEQPRLTDPR